ncbi:MAG: 3-methyladenine DNA glycosylase [Balneolaceae bacterium]
MIQSKRKFIDEWPILDSGQWIQRVNNHKAILDPVISPWLQKRSAGGKNPVMDFLFEYYQFRPSHLLRWTPGTGVLLEKSSKEKLDIKELNSDKEYLYLNPGLIPAKRLRSFDWILKLLEFTQNVNPSFGCFGMHEWAMVYKTEDIRHEYLSLRLPRKKITNFVESRPLVCTHFDAFRFFTDAARPLNKNKLSRSGFAKTEQPGCLHTNMDLYKWAFKGYPWIPGDLIRKAFLLALETRVIDMKASPYELSEYGLDPIKIETTRGRSEYLKRQKEIFSKSIPVRKSLIHSYKQIKLFYPGDS